jgi:hypothetical protein
VHAIPPISTVVVPPFTPELPISITVPPAVLPVLGVTTPVNVKPAACAGNGVNTPTHIKSAESESEIK